MLILIILKMNSENINSILSRRCCSFCRRPGHNISRCNSLSLRNFKLMCINHISSMNISDIIISYNIEDININNLFFSCVQNFRIFLLSESLYYSHLVKSFSRRYCGATSRDNIDKCIQLIINYFSNCIYNDLLVRLIHISTSEQELNIQPIQSNSLSENLLNAFIFSQMMNSINFNYNNRSLHKKFNINTKINECTISESCDCNICYETFEKKNFIKLNCGHDFCKICIKKTLENENKDKLCCPLCRAEVNEFEISNHEIREEFNDLIV